MKQMKTLTMPNGTTYEIVDAQARDDIARNCAPSITETIEGTSVVAYDSAERPLHNIRVFGKTEQVVTTGAQLLDFSKMTMDSGGTTKSEIYNGGQTVTITGTKAYAMGYIDIDVTGLVGKTLYLSGTKAGGNTPSITARLFKTDGTKTYIPTIVDGYTVLSDDTMISVQFIANNTATTLTSTVTATFTDVMVSPVKDAAWEPYTGGIPGPNPAHPQELKSAENSIVIIAGKNLLPPKTNNVSGYTVTVNDDGSVSVTGAANTTNAIYLMLASPTEEMPLTLSKNEKYYMWGESSNDKAICIKTINDTHSIHWNTTDNWNQNVGTDYMNIVQVYVESRDHTVGDTSLCGTYRFQVEVGDKFTGFEAFRPVQFMAGTRTLRAIPVPSLGNYTDANGQQWICDEIDFNRRLYIQRIGTTDLTNAEWTTNSNGQFFTTLDSSKYVAGNNVLCTHLIGGDEIYINAVNAIRVNAIIGDGSAAAMSAALSGCVLAAPLITPIISNLTDEEISAFESLIANCPSTTVLNSSGAWMEVCYNADLKNWIMKYVTNMLT